MDLKQRKNILSHLAGKAKDDPSALGAIQKEANKATEIMQSETLYDEIAEQIEILDTISQIVHPLAVQAFSRLIKRLETLELTYPEITGYPAEWMTKYRNSLTLPQSFIQF